MNQQELTTTTNGEFSIADFCDWHEACTIGYRWATANCTTMQDVWQKARPDWLLWVATRCGVLPEESLRRFTAWILEQIRESLNEPALLQALEVCRNWSTTDEATRDRVRVAVGQIYTDRRAAIADSDIPTVNTSAARAAFWSLCTSAVGAALESYSSVATLTAYSDSSEEFMQRAADWLRSNTQPCFERSEVPSEFCRD